MRFFWNNLSSCSVEKLVSLSSLYGGNNSKNRKIAQDHAKRYYKISPNNFKNYDYVRIRLNFRT